MGVGANGVSFQRLIGSGMGQNGMPLTNESLGENWPKFPNDNFQLAWMEDVVQRYLKLVFLWLCNISCPDFKAATFVQALWPQNRFRKRSTETIEVARVVAGGVDGGAGLGSTVAEFRRTHADTWNIQKDSFSEEQLEVLADTSSSSSYFA
nr:Proteasome activator subunit 4 [Ipomoea trifida]